MSYITVLPLMLNSSLPRGPIGVTLPVPLVSIQDMLTPGPAYSTLPLPEGISQKCESNAKLGREISVVVMNGPTGTPGNLVQPPVCDQISPSLPPEPPAHEPPSASTRPSCSNALA